MIQLRFDANQEFQLKAIEAVYDLFEGQTRVLPETHFALSAGSTFAAVPNRLDLTEERLLENLQRVQARGGIRCPYRKPHPQQRWGGTGVWLSGLGVPHASTESPWLDSGSTKVEG